MKMFQVRIDESKRAKFADTVPWGYQGKVVEELFRLLFERTNIDGPALTIAKLIDGRYRLVDFTEKEVQPLEIKDEA